LIAAHTSVHHFQSLYQLTCRVVYWSDDSICWNFDLEYIYMWRVKFYLAF
jgi:hypothetical protein